MLRTPRAVRLVSTTGAAALTLALALAVPAQADPAPAPPTGTEPVQVATGFLSPLHLDAGPNGKSVYVADAFVGAVHQVVLGRTTRTVHVADGLGFSPGIDVQGSVLWLARTVGGGGPEEQGATYLSRRSRNGTLTDVADLLAAERRLNPDGQVPGDDAESNPYDVLAHRGAVLVVDAAANAIWRVTKQGAVSVFTAFPNSTAGECAGAPNQGTVGCDAVPTGIAVGPDGYLWVSGLGAFAGGRLWKVHPGTGAIVAELSGQLPPRPGFTDVAVGSDGAVHVASLLTGEVFRLAGGTVTVASLEAPAGLLWMRGTLYASTAPAALSEDESAPPPPGSLYAVPAGAFVPVP